MCKKIGMLLALFLVMTGLATEPSKRDAEVQTIHWGDLIGQNRDLAVALADMKIQLRELTAATIKREKELQKQLDEKSEIIKCLSEELDAIEAEEVDDPKTTRRSRECDVHCKQENEKQVDCGKQEQREEVEKETEELEIKIG